MAPALVSLPCRRRGRRWQGPLVVSRSYPRERRPGVDHQCGNDESARRRPEADSVPPRPSRFVSPCQSPGALIGSARRPAARGLSPTGRSPAPAAQGPAWPRSARRTCCAIRRTPRLLPVGTGGSVDAAGDRVGSMRRDPWRGREAVREELSSKGGNAGDRESFSTGKRVAGASWRMACTPLPIERIAQIALGARTVSAITSPFTTNAIEPGAHPSI